MGKNSYVLMTAAKDEEEFIEKLIRSVIDQTVLPEKWIIASDASVDCTDEIVRGYAKKYEFITLLRIDDNKKRDFGSKVNALDKAFEQLKSLKFDFIGNLDADVSLPQNYYENILKKFERNTTLGIAGGVIFEKQNGRFKSRPGNSLRSVAGAVQVFRRKCYETIGGYSPLIKGGEDSHAEIKARMQGWQIKSFPELNVFHYRHTGSAQAGILRKNFNEGRRDFSFGNHPVFEICKCLRRFKEKPYFGGSYFRLCGYIWAYLKKEERIVSEEIIKYLRNDQVNRIKALSLCSRGKYTNGEYDC